MTCLRNVSKKIARVTDFGKIIIWPPSYGEKLCLYAYSVIQLILKISSLPTTPEIYWYGPNLLRVVHEAPMCRGFGDQNNWLGVKICLKPFGFFKQENKKPAGDNKYWYFRKKECMEMETNSSSKFHQNVHCWFTPII